MFIEKNTYGKTPAAIYLAAYLSNLDKPLVAKRAGKILHGYRNTFAELRKANEAFILSAHNLSRLVNAMRAGFHVDIGDEKASNLVTNVLVGEMKSLMRKASDIRKIELHQNKISKKNSSEGSIVNKDGYEIAHVMEDGINYPEYNVGDMFDDITAETLTEKWEKKMKRRNIQIP